MITLSGFILMLAAAAWVVAPLFRVRSSPQPVVTTAGESALATEDLHYQKAVASGIIQDLHFDMQTGKLSPEDHADLVREQEQLIRTIDEHLALISSRKKNPGAASSAPRLGSILFLLLILPISHSLAQNALFSGRLLDGSRDSSGVAGEKVTLQFFTAEHPPRDLSDQLTGIGGAFSFKVADVDTNASYVAMVEYQGVRYYSDQASLARTSEAHHDVIRFDSTQSNREITVLMHHLFVQDMGESLALRETRVLNNPASKTILNAITDGHEGGAILKITLPPWANQITPITGPYGSDLHVHGTILYDTGVFEPGNRQLSFSYLLPWQRDRATLVIQVDQPTRSLDLFIGQQQGMRLEGEGVIDHGPFTIRGQAYQRYGIENAQPGVRLQLQVVRQKQGNQTLPPWVTLAATGALLLLGVVLARMRRAPKQMAKK